ncbi:response regulator [uncultured Flavobacterium sp.]|uniref:response regulator transcription factor n=1 Tax=uncultured Flavobacterium sp. TaxID=165435 RepID=UPI0030C89D43
MKKKSIWIVDDDAIFKIIIKKLIQKSEKFDNVETFSNGEEALLSLNNIIDKNERLPDVILLDIEMPIMDGWTFMAEIDVNKQKFENQNISIYISSSSIAQEDQIKADKNPYIKGFLTKPIALDNLIKIS